MVPCQRNRARVWDNTLLTAIAQQAVDAELAPTLESALTLVIPAFSYHNLLPATRPLRLGEDLEPPIRYSQRWCEEGFMLQECGERV
ncbi:hypothetical protein B0I37DRAFT_365855 [Chaetomium sp. MPI-CAGE-AT-0009]|nr:hypothetical protein B0I37DRAFT_365855 [Chaetomium sp. MPI-CAGE-AT-0009]